MAARSTTDGWLSVAGGRVLAMLTVKDTMTLDFEAQQWKYAGAKEARIRDLFGESATRYYQRLNALIDRPDAVAYAPLMVRRLQRMRSARSATRRAAARGLEI